MTAYRRKDCNGAWYFRKVVKLPDGRKVRIHGKPPLNTKAAAELAERAEIDRLLSPVIPQPDAAPTFAEFREVFMDCHVRANNKPSVIANRERILRKHLSPRFDAMRLHEIGRIQIDELKAALISDKKKPKTVNNVLGVLSKLLAYAVEVGVLDAKPRMGMFKIRDQPFNFLGFAEYAALVEASRDEPAWHAAIVLAGDAGLRRGELRALEWRSIFAATGKLEVSQALWENTMGTPKNGKARTLPMTKRLQAALHQIRDSKLRGPFLLSDPGGDYLSLEALRWNLPRLCRKAGIQEITWHVLRHSFCSHLAMRGAPVKSIQELAGHSDLTMTLRYMHLSQGEKDRAIALLDLPWTERGPSASEGTK